MYIIELGCGATCGRLAPYPRRLNRAIYRRGDMSGPVAKSDRTKRRDARLVIVAKPGKVAKPSGVARWVYQGVLSNSVVGETQHCMGMG